MSLDHEFILLHQDDAQLDCRYIHSETAIRLHDDLLSYIFDTQKWIPCFNPATGHRCAGLNRWGVTLITHQSAELVQRIFLHWADLFSCSPDVLKLTGGWSEMHGEAGSGEYCRLILSRDRVVSALRDIAALLEQVKEGQGEYVLFHQGI